MTDTDLAFTPAWRLRQLIDGKQLSPVEITTHLLERINALNPKLNAFLTVAADEALAAARLAEKQSARGETAGPLHGIPVPIKDLSRTAGIRTTRGSLIFKDDVPDADDMVVSSIKAAGGIVIGKTNTPEFGHRGTTENLLGDPCRNPWDLDRTSGGSSGGAAAAVASGLSPVAQGSDGGGSIRVPANYCGVFGLKPSRGRIPAPYGGSGGWNVFGTSGSLTRDVRDAADMLNVMSGPYPENPMSILDAPPDFTDGLEDGIRGLRVAYAPSIGRMPVDAEVHAVVRDAASLLAGLGAEVDEIDPDVDGLTLRESFRKIFVSDMSAGLGALLKTYPELLMPTMREYLELATTWTVADLARALRDMERFKGLMRDVFLTHDLLLSPVNAVPAFPIEGWPDTIDGQPVEPRWGFTPFCYLYNMTGQPAASVPYGFSAGGLPIGVQLVARHADEATLLRASAAIEAAHPWA
ncbi:MAG: amidase, partial [Chloroflexota bacterium]|nr:amidase [Chloroflexota bacterium]